MARDGSGIYTKPAGTTAVAGTTIESAKYNTLMDDIASDLNTDRPIVAGGTGESTVGGVRDAFEIDGKVLDKSGAYTALAADRSTLIRATATMTLTLSLAATLGDGWFINVIADTGTLTIDGAGSETIDGSTTLVLTVGQKATIICDGTSFYTLNALTAVEMAQLQAIGAVTISSGQWTYLGAMDQALATTDSVNFAAIDGPVGGNTPAAGAFTTVSSSGTATFNDLDGPIGGTTPAAGDFTTVSASGIADFADGAEATPSITNTGDLNTGMYFPAADTIAWSVNAGEAMRIDGNGDLGLGTTDPANGGIHIYRNTPRLRLEDAQNDTYSDITSDGGLFKIEVDPTQVTAGSLFSIEIDGGEKMRIEADGAMLLGTTVDGSAGAGDLVVNGGLYVGGSADANYLDDYEEGSWTPVLSDGTNADASYSIQVGRYIKFGNIAHAQLLLTVSDLGSVSGDLRITGLPFTASSSVNNLASGVAGQASDLAISAGSSITCRVATSATHMDLYLWGSTTGTSNLQETEWTANGRVQISVSYLTS